MQPWLYHPKALGLWIKGFKKQSITVTIEGVYFFICVSNPNCTWLLLNLSHHHCWPSEHSFQPRALLLLLIWFFLRL